MLRQSSQYCLVVGVTEATFVNSVKGNLYFDKYKFDLANHGHICQVSPQLSMIFNSDQGLDDIEK